MYSYVTHPKFQMGGNWLSKMIRRLPFRKPPPPPPRIDPNFFRNNRYTFGHLPDEYNDLTRTTGDILGDIKNPEAPFDRKFFSDFYKLKDLDPDGWSLEDIKHAYGPLLNKAQYNRDLHEFGIPLNQFSSAERFHMNMMFPENILKIKNQDHFAWKNSPEQKLKDRIKQMEKDNNDYLRSKKRNLSWLKFIPPTFPLMMDSPLSDYDREE